MTHIFLRTPHSVSRPPCVPSTPSLLGGVAAILWLSELRQANPGLPEKQYLHQGHPNRLLAIILIVHRSCWEMMFEDKAGPVTKKHPTIDAIR